MDVMMNMTTDDIRRLRRHFSQSLDLEAFVQLLIKSLSDRIDSELDFVVGVIELFHTIDVNGDAMLDWDEFASYMMDAGQARADFYFETPAHARKRYVPLTFSSSPSKPNLTTPIQQLTLLTEQNAVAYFQVNSDVVYIDSLFFDRNKRSRNVSTLCVHTAFQPHVLLDLVYVPVRTSLVTSSVLTRGYLSIWNVNNLLKPVMTHRFESLFAQEHLCWVPSLNSIATSAVLVSSFQSDEQSDFKRQNYCPNACMAPPYAKLSQLQLWDVFHPSPARPSVGTRASKDVRILHQRLKGVTGIIAFQATNRTYFALGRENGLLSVINGKSGHLVRSFDAHWSGVKVLVYSKEVACFASAGFHSPTDDTSLHILIWKTTNSTQLLRQDTTLRHHQAPVELLTFVDSKHQLISVDRSATFTVYSSVLQTSTSEAWECLQIFQSFPSSPSTERFIQHLSSMVVVPETAASDAVLITAGTHVRFYDYCQVNPREEIFFACYCHALNVLVGATSTQLLLWKGDTGILWKTYEYERIVLSDKYSTTMESPTTRNQSSDMQGPTITAVCVDDRERKIIIGDDLGRIKVLNLGNGNVMKELDPHTCCVEKISYVLYRKRVLSISSDSVLHISDENNPQGYYVPTGGGSIHSVLLRSLHLLPKVELKSVSFQTRDCFASLTDQLKGSRQYILQLSRANAALNLIAVLLTHPSGDSFIQVWHSNMSQSQGTCIAPALSGVITCMNFIDATADIVGGTSSGRVFLWSPVSGTTSYRCLLELTCSLMTPSNERRAESAIINVVTVCALITHGHNEAKPTEFSEKPSKERWDFLSTTSMVNDCRRLEDDCGVYVFASDEAGFVTRWHVPRPSFQSATSMSRLSSSKTEQLHKSCTSTAKIDIATIQFEAIKMTFDSISALYHLAWTTSKGLSCVSVVDATHRWRSHDGNVLSLEIATDPLALVTSSVNGQIKVWSVNGEPFGVLDPFTTRREAVNYPWTFPVDIPARRRRREAEARKLLQKLSIVRIAERLPRTKHDLSTCSKAPKGNTIQTSQIGTSQMNLKTRARRLALETKHEAFSSLLSPFDSVVRDTQDQASGRLRSQVRPETRLKYSMVTEAHVKSKHFARPRSGSTIHCDYSPTENEEQKIKSKSIKGKPRVENAPVSRKELTTRSSCIPTVQLVEYRWQSSTEVKRLE